MASDEEHFADCNTSFQHNLNLDGEGGGDTDENSINNQDIPTAENMATPFD